MAVIAAAAVGRLALGAELEPAQLVARLKALGSHGAALPVFAALYVLTTSALLPSAVLHVVAGATWGFWGGLWPGLLLSNLVGHLHFAIGRHLGRERMRQLLIRRRWTAAIDELERSGVLTVLVLRQTPIPFMATNMVCGASPISWRQFFVGHLLGLLPGVVVSTWFSAALAEGVEGAREEAFTRVALAGGSVVVLAVVTRVVMGLLRSRRAAVQRTTPT
ncbi:MAG: TVP38/TMEM64 family protein [Myxococcaceae bacterium]|nr:TVP38/TMEM64 family protein [Myxococcaceae bacterium]